MGPHTCGRESRLLFRHGQTHRRSVLTIGPGVCIVEENEKTLIKLMKEEGCDVIAIPFSACYPFGGALNCFTLDIYRHGPEGKCYFPSLDEKQERDSAKAKAQG